MAQIRVGIIGAGGIAGGHAAAYLRRGDVRLVAVADVEQSRAQKAASDWGCEACSVEALLERRDVDAVSICTPPDSHAALTVQALQNGKHVLVEKPIAPTLAEADAMIAAAERSGRLLMVGHTHRYWPANRRAKQLLEEGAVGDLIAVSDEVLSRLRAEHGVVPWRLQRSSAGGGVVMDNGVHSIDRLAWWIGSPIKTVYAKVSTDLDPVDVENNAVGLFTCENGVYAQTRLSFTVPPAAGRCRTEFQGTRGVLTVETWGRIVLIREGQDPETIPYDASRSGLDLEIEDFIESIHRGREPLATARAGRAALEVVLAMYRSAATGGAVVLPLEQ